MKIAFIGIGVMGAPMAKHLISAGHQLTVYTRTKDRAVSVLEAGAIWANTVKQCVDDVDVVITMVGFPADVEHVYFGNEGIIENAEPGTLLIDMTTTRPSLAVQIYEKALEYNLMALDAPVSGGDVGAQAGTLSIMVGGDSNVFERAYPLFQIMGDQIIYEGKAGSGQHTKMANQIAIAGTVSGVAEAIAYGQKMGLNLSTMLESISAGAAGSWQMHNLGPKMAEGDDTPGFFIKHFIKDMGIALTEAHHYGLQLPVLDQVKSHYDSLAQQGCAEFGTQSIIRYYDNQPTQYDDKEKKLLGLIRHQLEAYIYECGRERAGKSFHREDQRRQWVVAENLVEALNIISDESCFCLNENHAAGWVELRQKFDDEPVDESVMRLEV